MKHFYFSFLLFLICLPMNGQDPNWSVNTRAYEFSMSFTAVLNVNGNRLTNANDKVAAFVGNEIRGTGNVSYDADDDKYVVFFRVYANTTGETINFKIYDSTNDVVVDIPKTTTFNIDQQVGGVFQSYSIASPTLNSETNIIDFSFQGITETTKTVDGSSLTFLLPQGTNITSLVPVFTLSNNARLFKNFVRQESGITASDFTNDVTYTVLSADETATQDYSISVSVSSGGGSVTATLQSANSTITNNVIININLTTNAELIELNSDDFNVTNCVIKSMVKRNSLTYDMEVVPVNQGNIEVQLKENSVTDANANINSASNVLSFTFDNSAPIIKTILRSNPSQEVTGANEVIFEVIFNEPVENVSSNQFTSVSEAILNLIQKNDTTYTIGITGIDEFDGVVFVKPKESNAITDKAGNSLRISNRIDF